MDSDRADHFFVLGDPQRGATSPLPPEPEPNWLIMGCSCGCTDRDRQCRYGRKLLAEQRVERERAELRSALTDADVAWLREHGWTPC